MHTYNGELTWIGVAVYVVVGLFAFGWITSFFVVVQQKHAKVIEVFGKFSSIKTAGLGFKPPFPFSDVAQTLNLKLIDLADWLSTSKEEEDDEDEKSSTADSSIQVKNGRLYVRVMCSDDVFVDLPTSAQVQIIEGDEYKAAYELDNPGATIAAIILNKVGEETKNHMHDDIYKKRSEITKTVITAVNEELKEYGYHVVRLLIDEIDPGEEMRTAFNRVRTSKLLEQAADGEAKANEKLIVGKARAKKESLVLSAEGYKEAREKLIQMLIDAKSQLGEKEISLETFVQLAQGVDGFDAARDSKGVVVMQTGGGQNTGSVDIGTITALINEIVDAKIPNN